MTKQNRIVLIDYNSGYHYPALYDAVSPSSAFYVFGPTRMSAPSFEGARRVFVEPNDFRRRTAIVSMAENFMSKGESCAIYTLDEVLILKLERELPSVCVVRFQDMVGHTKRWRFGHEQRRRRVYVIDYPSTHRFACRRIVATCQRYYIYSPFDESSEFPGAEQYTRES